MIGSGSTALVYAYATGDQRSNITVTTSPGLMTGTLSNLVNGVVTQTSDFFNVTALNGTQFVQFQFSTPWYINECGYYQNTAAAHGTWKWQASNDASSWTDIGSTFTLNWGGGVSTPFVMTSLGSNTQAYLYYRILGMSGSTSGAPWVTQFQFKRGT